MFKRIIFLTVSALIFLVNSVSSSEPFTIQVVCSSFLKNDKKYSISNVFDGDITTCWADGVATDGSGQMIRDKIYGHADTWSIIPDSTAAEMIICYLPHNPPEKITKIRIYNGYGKSEILWNANNRIKKLGISIVGYKEKISNYDLTQSKLTVNLKDIGWNEIIINDYLKEKDKINFINRIQLYIIDTYKGNKYNDTCISEIEFYNSEQKYHIDKVTVITPRYGIHEDDEEG